MPNGAKETAMPHCVRPRYTAAPDTTYAACRKSLTRKLRKGNPRLRILVVQSADTPGRAGVISLLHNQYVLHAFIHIVLMQSIFLSWFWTYSFKKAIRVALDCINVLSHSIFCHGFVHLFIKSSILFALTYIHTLIDSIPL